MAEGGPGSQLLVAAMEALHYFYDHPYGGIWTGCFRLEHEPDCRGAIAGEMVVIGWEESVGATSLHSLMSSLCIYSCSPDRIELFHRGHRGQEEDLRGVPLRAWVPVGIPREAPAAWG